MKTRLLLVLFLMLGAASSGANEVTLTVDPDRALHRIDERIYGHFLEHIYHSVNGGLWGEIVWDRSFEGGGAGVDWRSQGDTLTQNGTATNVRLVFGSPDWTDYEFTVDARKQGGAEGFLLLLRARNDKHFYWANLGGWGNVGHALERGLDEQERWNMVGRRTDGRVETGRWYRLRGRCEGRRIQVWIDDELVIDHTDDGRGPRRGAVGVGTWETQAEFRNFKVTSLDGRVLHEGLPPLPPPELGRKPTWRSFGEATVSRSLENPLNGLVCCEIASEGGGGGLQQGPLVVREGETYRGSLWASGDCEAGLVVQLLDGETILAEQAISAPDASWTEYPIELNPTTSSDRATLRIALRGAGHVRLDQVSLMPDSWRADGGFRPDLLEAIAELKPPVIRWPGGCFASPYRWKDAIGPQHERFPHPRYMWDDKEINSFGTDEFIALCRKVDAEPIIVINIGSKEWNPDCQDNDFLQEALDWLEYCNGPADSKWGAIRAANGHPEPYGVKYWEIDNETWHMGAAAYAEAVNRFAPALREADPSIIVIACGSGGFNQRWNRDVIRLAGENFDYISIHHYESPGNYATGPGRYEAFIRELGQVIAASPNPDMKIYCSEWNAQSTDWRTGLYCGGMLNGFERCGDIYEIGGPALFLRHVSASDWDNAFINFDQRTWFAAPNYVVMKLWRDHYQPILLEVEGDAGPLDVVATRSDDGRHGVIKAVNPTSQAVDFSLTWNGAALRAATMWQVAPGDLSARNTLENRDAVRPEPAVVGRDGQTVRVSLPPLSCGVVVLEMDTESP